MIIRGYFPIRRIETVLLLAACTHLFVRNTALGASSVLFASAIGGSQPSTIRVVSTDSSKNIYVVGETYSNDFPGASSSATRSSGDAFIVKLNSAGTQILYSTILGGSAYDSARAVAIDSAGNAYVTGVTDSSDLPATAAAFQVHSGSPGLEDAFVAKVNPTGGLVYVSYLGGATGRNERP